MVRLMARPLLPRHTTPLPKTLSAPFRSVRSTDAMSCVRGKTEYNTFKRLFQKLIV